MLIISNRTAGWLFSQQLHKAPGGERMAQRERGIESGREACNWSHCAAFCSAKIDRRRGLSAPLSLLSSLLFSTLPSLSLSPPVIPTHAWLPAIIVAQALTLDANFRAHGLPNTSPPPPGLPLPHPSTLAHSDCTCSCDPIPCLTNQTDTWRPTTRLPRLVFPLLLPLSLSLCNRRVK